MFHWFNNKKGVALPVVLMIMVVLTIIGMAILNVSLANIKHTFHQEKTTQAYYAAKSGIQISLKKVESILAFDNPENIDDVIDLLNPFSGTIPDGGEFSVTYDDTYAYLDAVKIISVGEESASNIQNTVTLTMKFTFPLPSQLNPTSWTDGINLSFNTNITEDSYIGNIIKLASTNTNQQIQSPQNHHGTPVFQASCIYITETDGVSLKKMQNSANVTFDAEILYFQGEVLDSDGINDYIYLAISTDVVNDDLLSTYDSGFENYYRYFEYANTYDGITKDAITYEVKSDTNYPCFGLGTRYGLVRFASSVKNDLNIPIITPGYYFYPDNLQLLHDDVATQLIRIDDNDAIILALENMFIPALDNGGHIWGRN